jgi:hypothetical protein
VCCYASFPQEKNEGNQHRYRGKEFTDRAKLTYFHKIVRSSAITASSNDLLCGERSDAIPVDFYAVLSFLA